MWWGSSVDERGGGAGILLSTYNYHESSNYNEVVYFRHVYSVAAPFTAAGTHMDATPD